MYTSFWLLLDEDNSQHAIFQKPPFKKWMPLIFRKYITWIGLQTTCFIYDQSTWQSNYIQSHRWNTLSLVRITIIAITTMEQQIRPFNPIINLICQTLVIEWFVLKLSISRVDNLITYLLETIYKPYIL